MSLRRLISCPIRLMLLVTLGGNILCRKCGARRLLLVLLLAVTGLAWVYLANQLSGGASLQAFPLEEFDLIKPRGPGGEGALRDQPRQSHEPTSSNDTKGDRTPMKKSQRENARNRTSERGETSHVKTKAGNEGNYTAKGHQQQGKEIVGGEGKAGGTKEAVGKEKLRGNGSLPYRVEIVKQNQSNASRDPLKPARDGHVGSRGSPGKELLPRKQAVEDEGKVRAKAPMSPELSERGNGTGRAAFFAKVKGLRDAMEKHGYNLLLNEPAACRDPVTGGRRKDVFLLILITTTPEAQSRRRAIRESWASVGELMGRTIVRLFLLGASPNASLNELVERESLRHRDLLVEDFADTYRNLSLKTLMGMKWMIAHCPQAAYVMKTDDDMYIGLSNLIFLLTREDTPDQRFVTGHVFTHMPPIRESGEKNYMPSNLFRGTKYPPYCAGAGYVMSGDVVPLVYTRVFSLPRFVHIEDVMVGICLNAMGIRPVHNDAFRHNAMPFVPYSFCAYRQVISMHGVSSKNMTAIWRAEHSNHAASDCPNSRTRDQDER